MIIGLICVRDDHDILRDTLQYHLENGVDCLGIIEHQPSDETLAILDEFPAGVIKSRVRVSQTGFFPQVWLNELRREMQRTLHLTTSDWFAHFDADERWEGLTEAVEAVPDDIIVVESEPVINYLPDQETVDADDILGCDITPKVLVRAASGLTTMTGQHRVVRVADVTPVPEENIRVDGFRIHHYPVRNADQFVAKISAMQGLLDDRNSTHPEGRESYWLWREWVSVLKTGGEEAVRDLFNQHLSARRSQKPEAAVATV
jgi:hypothetical protein